MRYDLNMMATITGLTTRTQLARVILSGAEEQVLDVIRRYYNF